MWVPVNLAQANILNLKTYPPTQQLPQDAAPTYRNPLDICVVSPPTARLPSSLNGASHCAPLSLGSSPLFHCWHFYAKVESCCKLAEIRCSISPGSIPRYHICSIHRERPLAKSIDKYSSLVISLLIYQSLVGVNDIWINSVTQD